MGRKGHLKGNRGFTLVELLIVVAIIGVLSTVGIPTFRRMIQKSKKSEAQVNLGNLFTIESSFFSEYGAYGTNLGRMGYQIDGAASQLTYVTGFPGAANCGTDIAAAAIQPTAAGNTFGPAIALANPDYYNAPTAAMRAASHGRVSISAGCIAAAAATAALTANTTAAITALPRQAYRPDVGSNFANYRAVALGCVRSGVDKDTCGGAVANWDVWHIDQNRQLSNVQDGIN